MRRPQQQQQPSPIGAAPPRKRRRRQMDASIPPAIVAAAAAAYVGSGVAQPLMMTLCKFYGLADPKAQLYMVFYYIGPSLLGLCVKRRRRQSKPTNDDAKTAASASIAAARRTKRWQAIGVAFFDIAAQAMNYTGASLAGPTIFAILYSSVTIWTAVFSRCWLGRQLSNAQWAAIAMVFGGLSLTAWDSLQIGPDVARGTILVALGSAMHAGMYVVSEHIMTGPGGLSIEENASTQGLVALTCLGLWQIVYTMPRWDRLIGGPVRAAQTTGIQVAGMLGGFAVANLVHSWTFFHTLRHIAGGATTAGVLKALQAVLVFAAAHVLYCHPKPVDDRSFGGEEMCFSVAKLGSLLTVIGGVVCFGIATSRSKDATYTSVPNHAEDLA